MTDQPDPVVELDDLRQIHALRRGVSELERDVTETRSALILRAREAGLSWREIGEAFDVSPQRAYEMAHGPSNKKENPS